MRTQLTSRLTRLEHNAGTGSRRIVVVGEGHVEEARAFLSGRHDVDMDRLIFVVTGVRDSTHEDWLRAARGEALVSRYGGEDVNRHRIANRLQAPSGCKTVRPLRFSRARLRNIG